MKALCVASAAAGMSLCLAVLHGCALGGTAAGRPRIIATTDDGRPPLTRYGRMIVKVAKK